MTARSGLMAMSATVLMLLGASWESVASEEPVRGGKPAGAFNLRVLSDSTPDFSSRENFVFSALSPWTGESARSLAQWRWMHRCRRVGSYVPEDARPVLDPVLFFNSYGVTYCSMIAQMNCSIWEARGLKNRVVDLHGHVVSEVFYDGAWHMFDNDFCNYFLNEKGEVAGSAELANSRIHGNVADLAAQEPGEFYIFDHCPSSSTPRGRIFMGPSSASLIEVARDWWPGPKRVRPRLAYTGSHAGHRYVLGLRPRESYTRHWRPLGTGTNYARPFRNGKDPAADGTVLKNSRSNGRRVWRGDLSDPSTFHAAENVTLDKDGATVKDPTRPGFVVFRVMAANVVTNARWPMGEGKLRYFVSGNHGVSWAEAAFSREDSGTGEVQVTGPVAGRLEYLLKVQLHKGDRLKDFPITTTTQVNPRTLPALRLGTNNIVAVSDGHYETITFNPPLTGDQAAKGVFRVANFQGLKKPRDSQPSILGTGPSELVLRAETPRPIQRLRMATTLHHAEPGADFVMSVSFDGGKQWRPLRKDGFAGWPADHRYQVELDKIPAGARGALMKYAFDSGGCGLVNVFAEVNYEPAGGFMPYDVTYCWSEWQGGRWVERRHVERVAGSYHKYRINVGGARPPRMNWVRIGPAGEAKPGYSDGRDVGDTSARPGYRLRLGKLLSKHCAYQASRGASEAFPDIGGKLLTDGYFGVSSYWGLSGVNLAGKKNERRVGDLVVWKPSREDLVVTVDLGSRQGVGGVRICALQPNEKIHYPARMTVETSADGKRFVRAGEVGWEECFFPPADAVVWEGADSPVYEALPAGGILDCRYPVVFTQPVEARYVRFGLSPPADPAAAIALWEVEVYDRIERIAAEEPIRLPQGPQAKE